MFSYFWINTQYLVKTTNNSTKTIAGLQLLLDSQKVFVYHLQKVTYFISPYSSTVSNSQFMLDRQTDGQTDKRADRPKAKATTR